jgi:hypothetical protein
MGLVHLFLFARATEPPINSLCFLETDSPVDTESGVKAGKWESERNTCSELGLRYDESTGSFHISGLTRILC